MYHYLLEPNDVLSFRDGKPFGSADDHNVMLEFPPSPATFYGAIRSSILAKSVSNFSALSGLDDEAKSIVGTAGQYSEMGYTAHLGTLEISRLLFYHKTAGVLFPAPADLVQKKKTGKNEKPELKRLALSEIPADVQFSLPEGITKILHSQDEEFVEGVNGFLTLKGMKEYFAGGVPGSEEIKEIKDLYASENRVGIGRSNKTRTVRTGSLFTVEFARLKDEVSFYLETNHQPGTKTIKLGGEGRTCKVSGLENQPALSFEKLENQKGVKVIVLTPLCSQEGWKPDKEMIKALSEKAGSELQLEAASVKRHRSIGGWDIVMTRPKTMRRYIPEGSVFYFKSDKNSINITPELFQLGSAVDKKQGFGLTLLGGF